MKKLLGLVLAITACNTAPLTDGGRPPSGVYQMTTSVRDDDCSERDAASDSEQAVVVKPDAINVPLLIGGGSSLTNVVRVDIGDQGYSAQLSECDATDGLQLALTHFDEHSVDVRRTDAWSATDAATPGCGVPAGDCSSVIALHFELVSECDPPCAIVEQRGGGFLCNCQ